MSRRDSTRRQYRRALLPGLVLSVIAHALALGLGGFDVPLWTDGETSEEDAVDRFQETTLQVVAVRRTEARRTSRADVDGASSASAGPAEAGAGAPAVQPPRSPVLAVEPVPVPAPAPPLRSEERRRERLSATDLAALYPGSSEVPRPTSRAAREASGEYRDVGDRFGGAGGTRRAGPRGGECTASPGTIIDRRFPEGTTIGGT